MKPTRHRAKKAYLSLLVISWWLQIGCEPAPSQAPDLPHAFHSLFHGCIKCYCLIDTPIPLKSIPSPSSPGKQGKQAPPPFLPFNWSYPYFQEPSQLWHLSLNPTGNKLSFVPYCIDQPPYLRSCSCSSITHCQEKNCSSIQSLHVSP